MKNLVNFLAGAWLVTLLVACSPQAPEEPAAAAAPAETAEEFVARVNAELEELGKELSAAAWVRATYITEDTAVLATTASARYAKWHSETVQAALAFNDVELDASTRRAIERLKLGTSAPAPGDPAKRNELAALSTELEGIYNTGQYCRDDGECLYGSDLEQRMATARDYDDLLDYWSGWRSVAAPMRDKYVRFVELANEGAVELGYANVGEMWRSNYDMSPAEFQSVSATLWDQVKPLYDELHCHVRAKLGEVYGADKVPQDGPIPAHLLGNMWSQQTFHRKRWCARPRTFMPRLVCRACPIRSGSARSSRARRTAKSIAMPAPGAWMAAMMFASRCASTRPMTSCA
jgi:peptidyl-dipeptidase A